MPKLFPFPITQFYSSSKIHQLIHQCYTNSSIQLRVDALNQLPDTFTQLLSINSYTIQLPQFLHLTTGKILANFHNNNHTPIHLQILHSLSHIQFNAFLAYMDTLIRFGYSQEYQYLWRNSQEKQIAKFRKQIKKIAKDEGSHCLMLINRLKYLGINFGTYPVISNLTNTISLTNKDIIQRFALISIIHEGKGIKSLTKLIDKIKTIDEDAIKILKIIQIQQSSHFEIGLKWFKYFCLEKYHRIRIRDQSKNIEEEKLCYRIFLENQLQSINNQFKTNLSLKDIRVEQQPILPENANQFN